jgi:hypothetical protein
MLHQKPGAVHVWLARRRLAAGRARAAVIGQRTRGSVITEKF